MVVTTERDWLAAERPLIDEGHRVVGLDEVGRGALAGPVCVGAVLLSTATAPPSGLDDSKRLSARRREGLVAPIERWATDWAIGQASAEEIDAWGIRWALALAADRALRLLRTEPTYALIDGPLNLLRPASQFTPAPFVANRELDHRCIIRGDQSSATIAAAAVVAKVHRDRLMTGLAAEIPDYGWATNMGYGSRRHLDALRELGPSPWHRISWRIPVRGTREGAGDRTR